MEVKFTQESTKYSENIVIVIDSTLALPQFAKGIEKVAGVSISKILKLRGYKGNHQEAVSIHTSSDKIKSIFIVGAGKINELDEIAALKLGGKIYLHLRSKNATKSQIYFAPKVANESLKTELLCNIMLGALLRSYKFDKYLTKKRDGDTEVEIQSLDFVVNNANSANIVFQKNKALYEGIKLTKTLALEPANIMNPVTFAKACRELEKFGVTVDVLDEKQMAKLKMNALLGVAQGSVNKPRLVVMRWNGGKKGQKPIAFVGKGVTFDTGGLSLKSPNNMLGMKYDKTGAAVVTGLMKVLALRKAKINVVGVAGLVENMPDGNAQRPEDIIVSMSGQTIEILNTDAEGRLVLADALWYTQDKFKPAFMIDLATLTGAIRVCLGEEYAGLFSNDDTLADNLYKSGTKTGEKVWRLPLNKEYDKMIDSKVADVQNVGSEKGAGSITAAQFLKRFVNNCPWAHLDIAAVSTSTQSTDIHHAGASAFGVRLLNQLITDYYE